jgi:hypothetical protein
LMYILKFTFYIQKSFSSGFPGKVCFEKAFWFIGGATVQS